MLKIRNLAAFALVTLMIIIPFSPLLENLADPEESDISRGGDAAYSHMEGTQGDIVFGLSLGQERTCAILFDTDSNPDLHCWGKNQNQLPTEIEFSSGYNVIAVTSGSQFDCAITVDGTAECWGRNDLGQLGDGTNSAHPTPAPVSLPVGTRATSIDAGEYHACALLENGSVYCWGQNSNWQLGIGSNNPAPRLTPREVMLPNGRTAISIAAGSAHTCAILDDGSLNCWGGNNQGEIGDGSGSNQYYPTPVDLGDHSAIAIGAGVQRTCAILDDGRIMCWGGEIGGPTSYSVPTEVTPPVSSESQPVMIAVGARNACVILEDATLHCWGGNNKGQLADGTTNSNSEPIQIDFDSDKGVVAVDVGGEGYHICAILDDGSIACWGGNSQGQLGDGTTTDRSMPTNVHLGMSENPEKVSSSGSLTCVLYDEGSVLCAGGGPTGGSGSPHVYSHTPTLVGLDLPAIDIGVGGDHACALLQNNSIVCWGDAQYGQLGHGTTIGSSTPVYVNLPAGHSAVSISVKGASNCAVLDDYSLVCWGLNRHGQLGDGATNRWIWQNSSIPTQVNLGSGAQVIELSSGAAGSHFCATFGVPGQGVSMKCWGLGAHGQLGNGIGYWDELNYDSSTPVSVEQDFGANEVVSIATGGAHTCVLLNSGQDNIRCWGYNYAGQLGDGTYCYDDHMDDCDGLNAKPLAVSPIGPTGPVSSLSTGGFHTCALWDDGPRCWGTNGMNESGVSIGSGHPQRVLSPPMYPINFPGESNLVISIDAVGINTCALLGDEDTGTGTDVYCWGWNGHGQLGDGTIISRISPTRFQAPIGYSAIGHSDLDGDGVLDSEDECQGHDDSVDLDGDGLIDGCDPLVDVDGDGVGDDEDAFPNDPGEQFDTDGDGTGDNSDLCQGYDDAVDVDLDGIPDECDSLIDSDNDGISDADDQCPGYDDNDDIDGDGLPSACDSDDDGDGVSDPQDRCAGGDDRVDEDSDGTPDDCDDIIDSDFDGISDTDDECDGHDDATDIDSDGTPDGCDDFIDSDHDGYPDTTDVCPGYDDLVDQDSDGVPDGCDSIIDSDLDGVRDADDSCDGHDDSIDEDFDGNPDGCEMWILTESTQRFVMERFGVSLAILFVFVSVLSRRLH